MYIESIYYKLECTVIGSVFLSGKKEDSKRFMVQVFVLKKTTFFWFVGFCFIGTGMVSFFVFSNFHTCYSIPRRTHFGQSAVRCTGSIRSSGGSSTRSCTVSLVFRYRRGLLLQMDERTFFVSSF
jgi:hypothetical protein